MMAIAASSLQILASFECTADAGPYFDSIHSYAYYFASCRNDSILNTGILTTGSPLLDSNLEKTAV